jgi:hypothetical protein
MRTRSVKNVTNKEKEIKKICTAIVGMEVVDDFRNPNRDTPIRSTDATILIAL